ncbi:MAG: ABC transporter permease [Bifidobacteriales bacterium 56_10]|nr:MAG: ABC transporter permease [Bifidobacteriales bacterium 56_10]
MHSEHAQSVISRYFSTVLSICRRSIPTVIAVVLLLAVWETWVRIGNVPSTMIAAPSEIAQATVETWSTLWPATQVTLIEGTIGFLFAVLFGILIGILLYCSRIANAALFPLLSAAQTMPLISIAPLFLIWFGFEISGKIVIVTVFGLFPIAVQTIRGLEAVPQFYSDVALTCGATKTWTLWHVKLRVAARQIYGGIRVSGAYIFATAATAEYLGARKGLGIWLQAAYNSFRTPLIFSATLVIIVITGILMCLVNLSERVLLGPTSDDEDPDAGQ